MKWIKDEYRIVKIVAYNKGKENITYQVQESDRFIIIWSWDHIRYFPDLKDATQYVIDRLRRETIIIGVYK